MLYLIHVIDFSNYSLNLIPYVSNSQSTRLGTEMNDKLIRRTGRRQKRSFDLMGPQLRFQKNHEHDVIWAKEKNDHPDVYENKIHKPSPVMVC